MRTNALNESEQGVIMTDLRKAAEMALEALEWNYGTDLENIENCMAWLEKMNATIPALRQALAQPEQEQKTPLKVLNLTVFTENRLRNGRVYDVETLQAMTNRDILAIPDMGKKALKEVLEALDVYAVNMSQERVDEMAKCKHEPWQSVQCTCGGTIYFKHTKRKWVGLTDSDKQEAFDETQEASGGFWEFADYLEAKLKEKNT